MPFTKLRSLATKHQANQSIAVVDQIFRHPCFGARFAAGVAQPPTHPTAPSSPSPDLPFAQIATRKQIRELMQVEGRTNDEVKSHLQKYRLHVRKIPSCSAASSLWMSEDHIGDHSKSNISQSGSPQGPLAGNGSTKDNSMEAEEDEKSNGHSWKGGSSSFHKVGEDV